MRNVEQALRAVGFDLVHWMSTADYDAAIADHDQLDPLPTFGRGTAQALLIGNTRRLWDEFAEDSRARPGTVDLADPLDHFVERQIHRGLQSHSGDLVVLTATATRGRVGVSLVRAAVAGGLAELGPVHLAVHPDYGPWFGLRALIVFDRPVLQRAVALGPSSCRACSRPCSDAMKRVLELDPQPGSSSISRHWRSWVAVRDACPIGREHRYGDEQVRYHYTKDKTVLVDLARAKINRPVRKGS